MALKVRIGTMEVEMDTIEQVAELARRLGSAPTWPQRAPSPTEPGEPAELPLFNLSRTAPATTTPAVRMWDQEAAWKFLSALTGNGKSFMGALMAAKTINSGDMAKQMGVQPNLLGPAIRSIKSKSKDLNKRVPFNVKVEAGKAGKTYSVTGEFYGAASQPPTGGQR
jgi:hypothetical protein